MRKVNNLTNKSQNITNKISHLSLQYKGGGEMMKNTVARKGKHAKNQYTHISQMFVYKQLLKTARVIILISYIY